MKRLLILFLVVFFVPVLSYGQMMVVDGAVASLLKISGVEQSIHYAQMVQDNITQIMHLASQVEYTIKSYEMAAKNLASIGDIRSWDDFMEWHNRQLYLERKTEEAFMGMNISIGKKNYSIFDVEGMTGGFDETYVKYWENEFTEDQRREMWTNLGLTSSNYAYVKTWQSREQELARQFLAGTAVKNAEYMESVAKANAIKERLAADKDIGELDKKEMDAMQIEMLVDIAKSLNDLNLSIALQNEMAAVKMRLDDAPIDAPLLAEWPQDAFGVSDAIEGSGL